MDFLWSPWRFRYVSSAEEQQECVFCEAPRLDDERALILYRGRENFIILNLYPYTTGHLMIAPYAHLASFAEAPKSITDEMTDLAKYCCKVLMEVYRPHGLNLGMNLGRAAGAGIADHFHLHVLPRWFGDTNFTTVIAETRVLPEDLETTYRKLKGHFVDVPFR
jgi:ATP adenylyltransferase